MIPRWTPHVGLVALFALAGLVAGIQPAAAIGLALGLAFTVIAFESLTAGLVLFTFVTFLEFVLPAGSVLTLTKLAGLLLATSWMARVATSGGRDDVLLFNRPVLAYLLGAFITWALLSLLWAPDLAAGLDVLSRYLLVMALFVIVFTAIRTRRDVAWIVGVFVGGAAITAAYALVVRPATDVDVLRVTSTVGNPNVLASILVAGLVLALASAAAFRASPAALIGCLTASAFCVGGLFLTGSRSGAIAFASVLVMSVLVAGRRRMQALMLSLVLAVGVTVSFLAFVPSEARDRVTQLSAGQQRLTEGRATLWQVGARIVEDRPVQGVGVGNFQAASRDYVLTPGLAGRTDLVIDDPQVAHNVYLQVAAELGIPGLALFLAILGYATLSALKAARRFARSGDTSMELVARAVVIATVAILVTDFFASEQFNKLLWLLLGLGPALLAISERAESEAPAAAAAQRRRAVGSQPVAAR